METACLRTRRPQCRAGAGGGGLKRCFSIRPSHQEPSFTVGAALCELSVSDFHV